MINKIKKMLLLMIMLLVAVPVVLADETAGKITINNATVDETYTIYKIFELESYNKSVTPAVYAYKMTDEWENFFAAGGAGNGYITVDEEGYVTATTLLETNTETFAKLALKYAKDNSVTYVDSVTATSATVEFEDLEWGYYLVDTTLGTLCSLDTTDNEVVIEDKNTIPTIVASVKENTTFGPTNDAKIGDTINSKLEINAYKGAEDYIVHATLASGIAFDSETANIVIKETTGTTTKTLVSGEDYNLVTSNIGSETFRIVFTDDYMDSVTGTSETPSVIEITYEAKLDSDATIGGSGNLAAYTLSYDEGSNKTSVDSTKTYTWPVSVYKFFKDSSEVKQPLEGAEFVLSTTNTVGGAIELVNVSGTTYRVALSTDSNKVTAITTTALGEFTIQGLDSGSYYLIETDTPDGYNKLTGPVELKIVSTTATDETMSSEIKVLTGESWSVTEDVSTVTRVEVENKSGTRLPATGGKGTALFIGFGSILFLFTAIVLITKKRMYNENL